MSARLELRAHLLCGTNEGMERTDELIAANDAQVLREAADEMDAHCEKYGVLGVGDRLRRMADAAEQGEKDTREGESTPQPADFFQPGHTYTHKLWDFRCDTVTTHPQTHNRTALGWFRFSDDPWTTCGYSNAHWSEHWTDVTEGGDAR